MDWRDYGREAKKRLAEATFGDREKTLAKYAESFDPELNPHTIRRAVSALASLDQLKALGPAFPEYDLLESAPMAVVEIAARWAREDVQDARKNLQEWAAGRRPVSLLAKKYKDRRKDVSKSHGRLFKKSYRDAAGIEILKALRKFQVEEPGKLPKGKLVTPEPPLKNGALEPDMESRILDGRGSTIGIIIVGPYSHAQFYQDRMKDWIARGFALSWIYDHVFLVLPPRAPLEKYQEACRAVRTTKSIVPSVEMLMIKLDLKPETVQSK
jgi:hypothetical protein